MGANQRYARSWGESYPTVERLPHSAAQIKKNANKQEQRRKYTVRNNQKRQTAGPAAGNNSSKMPSALLGFYFPLMYSFPPFLFFLLFPSFYSFSFPYLFFLPPCRASSFSTTSSLLIDLTKHNFKIFCLTINHKPSEGFMAQWCSHFLVYY